MDEREESAQEQRERPAVSGRLGMTRPMRQGLTQAARAFRKAPTVSERFLWEELRRGRLQGYTFRRQHPIGPFIADFCCPAQSLIVEIDGPIHASQQDADAARQQRLEARGYRILRIPAHDVETRMEETLQAIMEALHPATT